MRGQEEMGVLEKDPEGEVEELREEMITGPCRGEGTILQPGHKRSNHRSNHRPKHRLDLDAEILGSKFCLCPSGTGCAVCLSLAPSLRTLYNNV